MKIVLASDSDLICDRLMKIIGGVDSKNEIKEVHNVHDLLKTLKVVHPETVILDIRMMGIICTELISSIRKFVPKIILISTNLFPQYKKRFLSSGTPHLLDISTEFDKIPSLLTETKSVWATDYGPVI